MRDEISWKVTKLLCIQLRVFLANAMKKGNALLTGIVIFLIICTSGCISNEKGTSGGTVTATPVQGKTVEGNGTIWYIALSGGFYGILGDDKNDYTPVNLSDEYKVDGQRIAFKAVIKDKTPSTPEWGIPVEIVSIRKLPEGIMNVSDEEFYRNLKDIPPPHINISGGGNMPALTDTNQIPPPLNRPDKNN
jgi:hypothetical protein